MKINLLYLSLIFFAASLFFSENSYSEYNDIENVNSTFSASVWEVKKPSDIEFYFNKSLNHVGFVAHNVSGFNKLKYDILYKELVDLIPVERMISGTITNFLHEDMITSELILLGYCSSGGTCIYHNVSGDIKITIDFLSSEGEVLETVSKTITL